MSNTLNRFPGLYYILVPKEIQDDAVGLFVMAKTRDLLEGYAGNLIPNTVELEVIDARKYAVKFFLKSCPIIKDEDIYTP